LSEQRARETKLACENKRSTEAVVPISLVRLSVPPTCSNRFEAMFSRGTHFNSVELRAGSQNSDISCSQTFDNSLHYCARSSQEVEELVVRNRLDGDFVTPLSPSVNDSDMSYCSEESIVFEDVGFSQPGASVTTASSSSKDAGNDSMPVNDDCVRGKKYSARSSKIDARSAAVKRMFSLASDNGRPSSRQKVYGGPLIVESQDRPLAQNLKEGKKTGGWIRRNIKKDKETISVDSDGQVIQGVLVAFSSDEEGEVANVSSAQKRGPSPRSSFSELDILARVDVTYPSSCGVGHEVQGGIGPRVKQKFNKSNVADEKCTPTVTNCAHQVENGSLRSNWIRNEDRADRSKSHEEKRASAVTTSGEVKTIASCRSKKEKKKSTKRNFRGKLSLTSKERKKQMVISTFFDREEGQHSGSFKGRRKVNII